MKVYVKKKKMQNNVLSFLKIGSPSSICITVVCSIHTCLWSVCECAAGGAG